MMGTQGSHLFSAEVFSNRFYKSHDNGDAVDELGDNDKTFLYELPNRRLYHLRNPCGLSPCSRCSNSLTRPTPGWDLSATP